MRIIPLVLSAGLLVWSIFALVPLVRGQPQEEPCQGPYQGRTLTQEEIRPLLQAHALWWQAQPADRKEEQRANLCDANLQKLTLNIFLTDAKPVTGQRRRNRVPSFKAGAKAANLSAANLSGADLSEAVLSGMALVRANLRGATLRGAQLPEVNLGGANLQSADLSGANLRRAVLAGADLGGATLTGADLRGAVLTGAEHLTHEQLHAALIDEQTSLPAYLKPYSQPGTQ
jgi:uncharacterized protein YjbI with pentapeptide repeats